MSSWSSECSPDIALPFLISHFGVSTADGADARLLSTEFVKKYIQYAKQKLTPSLSEDAANHISEAYADLRARVSASERDRARTLPITARTLETLIRLASAHAKCHLRHLVTDEDATAAIELLHYALFAENRQAEDGAAAEGDSGNRKRAAADGEDRGAQRPRVAEAPTSAYDAAELEQVVEAALSKVFSGNRDDCTFDELYTTMVASDARVVASGREAVMASLDAMEVANKVMHREGRIHLI